MELPSSTSGPFIVYRSFVKDINLKRRLRSKNITEFIGVSSPFIKYIDNIFLHPLFKGHMLVCIPEIQLPPTGTKVYSHVQNNIHRSGCRISQRSHLGPDPMIGGCGGRRSL